MTAGGDTLRETASRAWEWLESGQIVEGRRALAEALERAGNDAPAGSRAAALTAAGMLAFRAGDNQDARDAHAQALELARAAGERDIQARALGGLARVGLRTGDLELAHELAEASVAIWRELGDEEMLARTLHLVPYIAYIQGDDGAARRGFEESLELGRRLGMTDLVSGELTNLGSVETRAGNLERALELCREAVELAWADRDLYGLPYCVVNMGGVASTRDDHAEAARLLAAGKAIFDRTGAALDPGTAIEFERHLARTRKALGERFQPEWDAGYVLDDQRAVEAALAYGS